MKTVLFGSDKDGLRNLLEDNQVHIYKEGLVTQKEFFTELELLQKNDVDKVLITETIPGPHNKFELVEKLVPKCEELGLEIIFVLGEIDDEYKTFLRENRIYNIFDSNSTPDDLVSSVIFDSDSNTNDDIVADTGDKKIVHQVGKHYIEKTVLTVTSPAGGGTGKSTLAVNIASALSKKYKNAKIALIELNEEKTDLYNFTESKTKLTGMDLLAKRINDLTDETILDAMNVSSIEKNLFILTGLRTTEYAPRFTRTIYKHLIKVIQKHHDFIIIDVGFFSSNATIQSILHSDKVIFVCSNTKRHLRTLNEKFKLYQNVVGNDIKKKSDIMINFDKAYGVQTFEEIEAVMDIKPIGRIGYNEKLASAFARNKAVTKLDGSKARKYLKIINKYIDDNFIYVKK